ncbi:unnamed protein product [Tilletia controversa]|nr:unnamed protein product [Tilletia controversa]
MMSAPSPYPIITDTTSPLPDDAQINSVLPSICVDYLSHHWDKDEQIWASWKAMTKSKNEITNGVRLENASWRTWAKQRGKLKTISPETLNWLKDSDVTWLYGPLHEKANPVPPPKQATFADRLGLENIAPKSKDNRATKRGSAASPTLHRTDDSGRPRKFGSDRRRTAGSSSASNSSKRAAPAPKSILKHRTIQDMLTLNIGRRAASPAIHTESMTGCLNSPLTPEATASPAPTTASSPSAIEASGQQVEGLFCTRSDTNLPGTATDASLVVPGTPTEGATDYLAAVRLTGSSSTSTSSSSSSAVSPSAGQEVPQILVVVPTNSFPSSTRPALVRAEGGDQAEDLSSASSSRRSLVSEDRARRSDRHISFNHRVEQCIALDETTTDVYSTTSPDSAPSQTPTAFGSNAAMMVPDSSSSTPSQPFLQLYEPDEQGDDDDYVTEDEDEEIGGGHGEAQQDANDGDNMMGERSTAEASMPALLHSNTDSQSVTSHVPLDDEDHVDYLRFKNASELAGTNGSDPRVYTHSASSEEDLSVASSSDAGYDSDALTMRSSSAGSISGSSSSHMSTRDHMMTSVSKPHRPKSRKGSTGSIPSMYAPNPTSSAMHTIAKLAPTLLKTSEAYPAPSPAVVDPSNFLQTLEHERSAEEERQAAQFASFHYGMDGGSGNNNAGPGMTFVSTAAPWSQTGSAYDSSYFAGVSVHSGTSCDVYGRSVPVSIPTFGGRDQQQRYDDRGLYSCSVPASLPNPSYQDHHQHVYGSQGSAPSSSYQRMEQGNYHHHHQQQPQQHYASQEYADGYLDYEDDDIDIDLSFDADDVDLDLDLDDDDDYPDGEQVYLNTYTTYRHQLAGGNNGGLGRRAGGNGDTGGKYSSAAAAAALREEAYERMQTSADSLPPRSTALASASTSTSSSAATSSANTAFATRR